MKKIFLVLVGAVLCSVLNAQVLVEGESALVYYSPKTMLCLDFSYTVTTLEKGPYAEFAESLLEVHDFVTESSTTYELKDVKIHTQTQTDFDRVHKVSAEDGIPMLLRINDKGLLTGYNVAAQLREPRRPNMPKDCKQPRSISFKAAPFTEDVMMVATPEAQAEVVAKQILHIRETRGYILTGEVEHAPADGEAMRLVLEELAQQEKALTELFVGKKTIRHEHKTIEIEPSEITQMLFFSEENGFTDADNIEADTIEVRMVCERQYKQHAQGQVGKKKTAPIELSPIVYNVPGRCEVSVVYQDHTIAGRTIPVAQFGVDVALPKNMFTDKELPQIIISDKTGNVESISK